MKLLSKIIEFAKQRTIQLLSKIIEFAKQRTIHLTVKRLQRPCLCYSVGGRSVVESPYLLGFEHTLKL